MRRRVQLVTLDYVLVVAEEGSFLGASRRIGIHHSALSRRIHDLEHALGTAIFERHTGGVRPTLTGAEFLLSLRRVLTDLEGALVMAEGRGAASISVGDTAMHATEILDAFADVIRSRPDVTLRFVERRTRRSA